MIHNLLISVAFLTAFFILLALPACDKYEDMNDPAALSELTCSGNRDAATPVSDKRLEGVWKIIRLGKYSKADLKDFRDESFFISFKVEGEKLRTYTGNKYKYLSSPFYRSHSAYNIYTGGLLEIVSIRQFSIAIPDHLDVFDFIIHLIDTLQSMQCYSIRGDMLVIAYGEAEDDFEHLRLKRAD